MGEAKRRASGEMVVTNLIGEREVYPAKESSTVSTSSRTKTASSCARAKMGPASTSLETARLTYFHSCSKRSTVCARLKLARLR
jgi:hypothetical protein